jgi:hypothetical protein
VDAVPETDLMTTRVSTIQILEAGICLVKLDSSRHDQLGPEEAIEIAESIEKICGGKAHCILTDTLGVVGQVEPLAREILSSHAGFSKIRKAEAFVVESLANRLVANFYIRFNRPNNPTKIFNKFEKALDWLRTQNV